MPNPSHTSRFAVIGLLMATPFLLPNPARSQAAVSVQQEDETVILDPFEVKADQGTRGYGSSNSMGGTRINAPLSESIQSVVSLNQEFIQDIAPSNLADALRFVSGVTKAEGEYSGLVSIRGIQANAIGFRDAIGDSLETAHGTSLPDPIEVERIEVVKGPAGVLYGSHPFGGIINRVTKRALETQRTEIGFEYTTFEDSESYYRGSLDTSGPLDADKKLRYRLLAAYQDGENHMHGGYMKRTAIGLLEYHPSSDTSVWGRVRYGEDGIFVAQDLWTDSASNMPFGYMPQNAYVGNFYGGDQDDDTDSLNLEAGWTQSFDFLGSRWHSRLLGRYSDRTGNRRTYIALGGLFYKDGAPLVVDGKTLTTRNSLWTEARAAGYDDIRENIVRRDDRRGESDGWGVNIDFTSNIVIGPTENKILVYAGTGSGESMQHRFRENWIAAKPSIFTYTSIPPDQVLDGNPVTLANEWTTTSSDNFNFAIQDNMSLFDHRLILVGGIRYDRGTTGVVDNRENVTLPDVTDDHWTPSYGLVGKPVKGVSIFLNHSETFQPQGGVNQQGERLRPLIGETDEIGIKIDLLENRWVATASYFDMAQENAFLKIINDDGSFFFTQVPNSETNGWELDLAGQPVDNLTFMVAYQWIDATTQNGLQVRGVPQGSTYKAAVRYAMPEHIVKGLQFGVTYEHINDTRSGDTNNTYFLPGYDLLGLFAIYERDNWRFQINVENATDEWYVAGATSNIFMRSGAPRYYKMGIHYTF